MANSRDNPLQWNDLQLFTIALEKVLIHTMNIRILL